MKVKREMRREKRGGRRRRYGINKKNKDNVQKRENETLRMQQKVEEQAEQRSRKK